MDRFDAITAFVKVVETGSFARAAERLDVSVSSVSRHVTDLEAHLGARLLNRTTRRLSLTEAGRAFHERCVQLLADLEEAEASAGAGAIVPRGTLRLSCGVSFGTRYVAAAVAAFMAKFPEMRFDLELSDRIVDLVEEGFDLAIRIARLESSSLIARRLSPFSLQVCGSPELIAKHGRPTRPQDLAHVPCIVDTNGRWLSNWPFIGDNSELVSVSVSGPMEVNSPLSSRAAAVAGLGFTILPDFIAAPAIEKGQLVPVLVDRMPKGGGIYAVYPHRRYLPAKVRVFVDFLVEWFKKFPCPAPSAARAAT